MKLHPRACLVCHSSFQPEEPEQWWCSPGCQGSLEVMASLNAESDKQVQELNQESEMQSEAEKARVYLKPQTRFAITEPRKAPEGRSHRRLLEVVGGLVELARRQPRDDAGLLLVIARTYLDRVIEMCDPEQVQKETE